MTPSWVQDAFVYHVYPLGLCGAPLVNDFQSAPEPRLLQLREWLPAIQELGCDTLLLGPVCESSSHGYDTADLFTVDRRLGSNADLAGLGAELRQRGMRLLLDGVFNHVGRGFWAFRDVMARREASAYASWFRGLSFGGAGHAGDGISYEGWAGHHDLVKLNHSQPELRAHLFAALEFWIREFGIAGLRLDAADVIDPGFLADLARFARALNPDFWLFGEMVHGDYRRLAEQGKLDGVTNYEAYKGLWSAFNDGNLFEIAYALQRQSGGEGIYRGLQLYNFADNHDVDRVASSLRNPAHLALLYGLLLTIPGIPSIYYGSEWGWEARRSRESDRDLRPACRLAEVQKPRPELAGWIAGLAGVRRSLPALRKGGYRQVHVAGEQLAFLRTLEGEDALVAVNSSAQPASLRLDLGGGWQRVWGEGEWQTYGDSLALNLPGHALTILRRLG